MKIGILTFHNAINYGAVLQCYALKEFLSQRGHDVQVIDYRVPAIEDYKKLLSLSLLYKKNGVIKRIAFLLLNFILYIRKKRVIDVFDKYLKLRLNLSKRVFSAQEIPTGYDCIFFGSDQIWNPRICDGFDPILWGQFKKDRTKFIAYAASLGELSFLSDEQWTYVQKHIGVFDYVSVRENAVRDVLLEKTSSMIDCCIDPTLMIDDKVLKANAVRPNINNYVLLYNVTKDKKALNYACRIASKLNCQVVFVEVKPTVRLKKEKKVIYKTGISPDEFLGYIKYARLTIGNSFHLIALSIVMETNFYSLDSYRPERVLNLLKQLELSDRHKKATDVIEQIEDIDFSIVSSKLKSIKEHSLSFIDKVGC